MASQQQLAEYATMLQTAELSSALQNFQQNPQALKAFLQRAQDSLYKDVVAQKDNAFQKVYGDLKRVSQTEDAILNYTIKNQQLFKAEDELYRLRHAEANAAVYNTDLAKRQYEINQWEVGNKLDTLFIYQQLFIILCAIAVMTFLKARGIMADGFYWITVFILVAIFTITVIYRWGYTANVRDQTFWNRRTFPKKSDDGLNLSVSFPNLSCLEGVVDDGTKGTKGSTSGNSITSKMETDISGAEVSIKGDISTTEDWAKKEYASAEKDLKNVI
jgi:hypothetical protein